MLVFLCEIIKRCLPKNVWVVCVFLGAFCESRLLLGIGTRLVVNSNGDLLHYYAGDGGTQDDYENSQSEETAFHSAIWMFLIIAFLIFVAVSIYFCRLQARRRRLRDILSENPNQEDVRTPVGVYDVPPDYTEVVDLKTMANNNSGSLNSNSSSFPGLKQWEAPPPPYNTVVPSK